MKDFLQGKPLGHPLHPLLVHFPVGLFTISLLFDLATQFVDAGNTGVRAAFYTMVAGLVMAMLAAIPGLVDWSDIRSDHPAKKPATTHMWLNISVVVLYVINVLTRVGELEDNGTGALSLVLSVAAFAILGVSGYLGGTVVYDDGVGVGRHHRHSPTPDETIRLTRNNGAVPGEYVAVADDGKLAEKETLRVELAGTVATVVNLGGQYFAFQEFCTHRFGPLSEGSFQGGQVRCPWHGSCFDVRSGEVTNGPAKVPLRTYPVRVREGKVEVRVPDKEYPGEESPRD
jgi:nitrite reductase/ring-hydroxylating ferredoxin subunit/uncharacterized membrane protein